MRYLGMPAGMWILFADSFQKNLTVKLKYTPGEAKQIRKQAHGKYRELIKNLPEFERNDRFLMNIVNCAMLSAFLLNLPEKPGVEETAAYYRASMMTASMKWFCRMSGKKKFSRSDIAGMKKTAAL